MLDQLMGTSRNGPDSSAHGVKFTDHKVCKSFLYGCCPHEILASTRMDLGECPKIHELALRADYQQASKGKDYFYDVEATEHLNAFIQDCDRRTDLAKKRLAETQEELSAEVSSKAEKVHELAEMIGKKLAQAEQAGAEGKVEESMKFMEEVEDVRKKKVSAELEYRNSMPASSYQQQKLRVCEVCSAYLGIHDNDRRLADHFGGKLHLGFIKIRERLEELLKTYEDRKVKRRELRIRDGLPPSNSNDFGYQGEGRGGLADAGKEREEREERRRRSRSRSRDRHRRRRSRSRSRSRDRHRRRRHKHRSRSRDRDRRRSRSRSRDYHRRRRSRSRSRDNERRSKARQRSPAAAPEELKTEEFNPNETPVTTSNTTSGDFGNGANSNAAPAATGYDD